MSPIASVDNSIGANGKSLCGRAKICPAKHDIQDARAEISADFNGRVNDPFG